MGVGMPADMLLHEFGSQVWAAFGEPPFHVGSSLTQKSGWRDVDVRLILSDEEYEAWGLGKPNLPRHNGKWVALCLAFSALGRAPGLQVLVWSCWASWCHERDEIGRASCRERV